MERRHPFLDHDGPIAFAHRSGAAEEPENTMVAFEAAIALGYRYLETDARVTSDRVVVAFHDERLDRLTDRTGAISELDYPALKVADAGYGFSPDHGASHPFSAQGRSSARHQALCAGRPSRRYAGPRLDAQEEAAMQQLLDLGVDGIMSDRTTLLRDVFAARGLEM